MKKVNKDSLVPYYRQVASSIKENINTGQWKNGERIPSEPELGEIFDVSRIVVRQAVNQLVGQGYLVKYRGKGTFVVYEQIVEPFHAQGSFTKALISQGIQPSTHVISKRISTSEEVPKIVDQYAHEQEYLIIDRLRKADDKAVILEQDFFSQKHYYLLTEDLENTPIMEIISKRTGQHAKYFEDLVDLYQCDSNLSKLLECQYCLRIYQRVLTEDQELIYSNIQYINGERYRYAVRYEGN